MTAKGLAHATFSELLKLRGLPQPVTEHRFCQSRRWRFDYAWPELRVAMEVEGGVWTKGRHVRGKGYLKDIEKYNAATRLRWRLLRVTPQQLMSQDTVDQIEFLLVDQRAILASLG